MAWIESHQSLLTHRKTIRASSQLAISKVLLIGHLHILWWWALDNLPNNGDLGDLSDAEIAHAAMWPKNANAFCQALTDAGFIDASPVGRTLHDWWEYAGKLNAKRAANKQRMSSARAAHVQGLPTNQPTDQQKQTNQQTVFGDARAASRGEVIRKFGAVNG